VINLDRDVVVTRYKEDREAIANKFLKQREEFIEKYSIINKDLKKFTLD
jgi:hypothetical protein